MKNLIFILLTLFSINLFAATEDKQFVLCWEDRRVLSDLDFNDFCISIEAMSRFDGSGKLQDFYWVINPNVAGNSDILQLMVAPQLLSGTNDGKCTLFKGEDSIPLSNLNRTIYNDVSDAFDGSAPGSFVNTDGESFEPNSTVLKCENLDGANTDFQSMSIDLDLKGVEDAAAKIFILNNVTMGYELTSESHVDGASSWLAMAEIISGPEGADFFDVVIGTGNTTAVDGKNIGDCKPGSATFNKDSDIDNCADKIQKFFLNNVSEAYLNGRGNVRTDRVFTKRQFDIVKGDGTRHNVFQAGERGAKGSGDFWTMDRSGLDHRCKFIDCSLSNPVVGDGGDGGDGPQAGSPGSSCTVDADCNNSGANAQCLDNGTESLCYTFEQLGDNDVIGLAEYDVCSSAGFADKACLSTSQNPLACQTVGETAHKACTPVACTSDDHCSADGKVCSMSPDFTCTEAGPQEVMVDKPAGGSCPANAPNLILYFRGDQSITFAGQTLNPGDTNKCVSIVPNGPCRDVQAHWGSPWLGEFPDNCPTGYYCDTIVVSTPIQPSYTNLANQWSSQTTFPLSNGTEDSYTCKPLPADYYSCNVVDSNADAGDPSQSMDNFPVGSCMRHNFSISGGVPTSDLAVSRNYVSQTANYDHTSCVGTICDDVVTDRGHIGCFAHSDCGTGEYCEMDTNSYGQSNYCKVGDIPLPTLDAPVSNFPSHAMSSKYEVTVNGQQSCVLDKSVGEPNSNKALCWGRGFTPPYGTVWDTYLSWDESDNPNLIATDIKSFGTGSNIVGSSPSTPSDGGKLCYVSTSDSIKCSGNGGEDYVAAILGAEHQASSFEINPGNGETITSFSYSYGGSSTKATACVTTSLGYLYCWGNNTYKRIDSDQATTDIISSPMRIDLGGEFASEVDVTPYKVCVILGSNRKVKCWGTTYQTTGSNLGIEGGLFNTTYLRENVTYIKKDDGSDLVNAYKLRSSGFKGYASCVITWDGTNSDARCWGINSNNMMSSASYSTEYKSAISVASGTETDTFGIVLEIAIGYDSICVVQNYSTSNSRTRCRGGGSYGQLGLDTEVARQTTFQFLQKKGSADRLRYSNGSAVFDSFDNAVSISGNFYHYCAVDADGDKVWCWGDNFYYQTDYENGGVLGSSETRARKEVYLP